MAARTAASVAVHAALWAARLGAGLAAEAEQHLVVIEDAVCFIQNSALKASPTEQVAAGWTSRDPGGDVNLEDMDQMLSMDFNKDASAARGSPPPAEEPHAAEAPRAAEAGDEEAQAELTDSGEAQDPTQRWKKFAKHLKVDKEKCLKGLKTLVVNRKGLLANVANLTQEKEVLQKKVKEEADMAVSIAQQWKDSSLKLTNEKNILKKCCQAQVNVSEDLQECNTNRTALLAANEKMWATIKHLSQSKPEPAPEQKPDEAKRSEADAAECARNLEAAKAANAQQKQKIDHLREKITEQQGQIDGFSAKEEQAKGELQQVGGLKGEVDMLTTSNAKLQQEAVKFKQLLHQANSVTEVVVNRDKHDQSMTAECQRREKRLEENYGLLAKEHKMQGVMLQYCQGQLKQFRRAGDYGNYGMEQKAVMAAGQGQYARAVEERNMMVQENQRMRETITSQLGKIEQLQTALYAASQENFRTQRQNMELQMKVATASTSMQAAAIEKKDEEESMKRTVMERGQQMEGTVRAYAEKNQQLLARLQEVTTQLHESQTKELQAEGRVQQVAARYQLLQQNASLCNTENHILRAAAPQREAVPEPRRDAEAMSEKSVTLSADLQAQIDRLTAENERLRRGAR